MQETNGNTGRKAVKVEVVACSGIAVTASRRRVKPPTCTTRLLAGPVKFIVAGASQHAALTRAGHVYATGYAWSTPHGERASLIAARHLAAGRYTLTLTSGRGSHRVTIRRPVLIR
jgi:hypothetical protein